MLTRPHSQFLSLIAGLALVALGTHPVHAVPSFARQTGLPCSSCHIAFPQLNTFGRLFKLNAYTLTGLNVIEAKNASKRTTLKLDKFPPLSLMLQSSFSRTNSRIPGTQNDNVQLPQELSLFFAGAISPNAGAFFQLTYDGLDGTIGMDNMDVRFARNTTIGQKPFLYGTTLNNNPTVQDAWNTSPAWGYPFTSSSISPEASAGAMVDGGLEQSVAGLGAYALYDNLVYAEGSVYRSAQLGATVPPDASSEGIIDGVAPYWRVALQKQWTANYLAVGSYGMVTKMYPMGVTGPYDRFSDYAADAQFENHGDNHSITVRATWIHEKQEYDATHPAGGTQNATNSLNVVRINASYLAHQVVEFTGGYFSTTGDRDMLLYAPDPIAGSRTGDPDTDGVIVEVDYMPWMNTRLLAQYVAYNKFNGASTNYDGSGRDASDNNTLYLGSWFAF